jgi:hypothetical protein
MKQLRMKTCTQKTGERERSERTGIMVNINNFMALKIYILIGCSRYAAVFGASNFIRLMMKL